MKILSVYRTEKGIIVERRNEFGTKFENVFETVEGMLECLDSYKQWGKIDDYELNISNEFWATVNNFLNTGEMPPKHGGKREGAGRPSLGTTKKVSLTLSDDIWKSIDRIMMMNGDSQSKVLRDLIEANFKPNQ